MNILFYCDEYPPYITGGIGSVTKIIAEELVRRGHCVYVIGYYPFEKVKEQITISNGVHIYRYNLNLRTSKLSQLVLSKISKNNFINKLIIQKEVSYIENKIEQVLAEKNIDILELTDYYQFNKFANNLKFKKFKTPTFLRIHGSAYIVSKHQNLRNIEYIKQNDIKHLQRCDYISSVSKFSLNCITNEFPFLQEKESSIIYNPIENSFVQNSEIKDSSTILFIGKVVESKGCYNLIKAFNKCAKQHNNIKLQIIGNGNIKEAMSLIDPSIKEQVIFEGYCNRATIKEAIDNCSFACIPSFFENFSMVALEIMARKKALIYTNRASGKEIIDDGINGILVDPDSVEMITNKINLLIEDPKYKNKLAENAQNTIKKEFTTSVIIKKIEDLYFSKIKKS